MSDTRADLLTRIRRSARAVSWGLAPLAIIAGAVWLLVAGTVCWSGRASLFELEACNYLHVGPDLSAGFLLGGVAVLVAALIAFHAEREPYSSIRRVGEHSVQYFVRRVGRGYRVLDSAHKAIVRSAFEMMAWAMAELAGLLVFYVFELAFPLGVLVILAFIRVLLLVSKYLASTQLKPPSKDGMSIPG